MPASIRVRVKPLEKNLPPKYSRQILFQSFDAGANNIVCGQNSQNQGKSRLQRHVFQTSRKKISKESNNK